MSEQPFDEIAKHDALVLLSLNRYPIGRKSLLKLVKHPVVAKAFAGLHEISFAELLRPEALSANFNTRVVYSYEEDSFALVDEPEADRLAFEAIRKNPAMADAMADVVNRMSMPEPLGQKRDIRNFLYAENWEALRPCFGEVNRIYSEKRLFGAPGQIFDFMFHHLDNPWVEKMDCRLLNILCINFLPYAMLRLAPLGAFVRRCLSRRRGLSAAALAALADYQLLNGRLKAAEPLLKGLSEELSTPRKAWKQFMLGKPEAAVKLYLPLISGLDDTQADSFFGSFPGLFAVCSLLSTRAKEHLEKALAVLERCKEHPLLGEAFAHMRQSIVRLCQGEEKPKRESEEPSRKGCAFARYLQLVASFWNEEEDLRDVDELSPLCKDEYPALWEDCRTIREYTANLDSAGGQAGTGILQCCDLRPPWERRLNRILRISSGEQAENGLHRLCWFCTFEANSGDFPVAMRPVEQKMGKHGNWSKGKQFNLRAFAAGRPWPSYFTLQDQLMCNILVEELRNGDLHASKENGFYSRRALETAIGHPLLFWEHEAQHFECLREKPVFYLKWVEEKASLTFVPHLQQGESIAIRNAQNDVLFYSLSERQSQMASEIGEGLLMPEAALSSLGGFMRSMVQEMEFFSEMPLVFTGVASRPASTELHLRLQPMAAHMKVELFLMPFPAHKELLVPGAGPMESLTCEAGVPIRTVRDFRQEHQAVEEFLAVCKPLDDATSLGNCAWELDSMEKCFDFAMALQELTDKIHVHWPEDKRIHTSRRLTKNDISLHCRPEGDWLFSLEGSVTLDDGQVVAIQEMLKAIRQRHGNYLVLDNGQVLALAESFRLQLEDIAASVSLTDEKVHFNKLMSPFMRSLLEGCISDEELSMVKSKADEIEEAMKLHFKKPAGLKATLRPYQKEGFEWLCRLDAWGVGACLADDMGLGKTIQVIAFMLCHASEGPSLVVAPTSVCNNWVSELERFAPSLNVIVFGGLHRSELFSELSPNTVMISSYGLLQSEEQAFRSVKWRLVVLDEAQAIKNHNTKRAQAVIDLNASFRMVTTGTPLENNLNELWSLFNFINPGLLDTHLHFQERFASPIENEKDQATLTRLSNIVKPFVLRRLKKDVLRELPSKTEISLFVSLSEEESHFYEALRNELIEEIHGMDSDNGMRMRVIAAITKLRLAVCNPKLVVPETPIASSKMEAFFELLDELLQAGHKILVFSQFVKHLALVRHEIEARGIAYQYLDGDMSSKERTAAVNDFQQGNGDVFLISLRAGGMGLNLTAADYVIHLDPWWNPAVEDQASDRAYRIGQDKPVTIYRLIAKNTIEDKIIELHQNKRELAENLLEGTDVFNHITKEELVRLLKG